MDDHRSGRRWAWAVYGLGGTLAVWLLVKRKFKQSDPYDGLDGVVSESSRKIAAARAVESEEVDSLVRDPLAAFLAGKKYVQAKKDAAKPYEPPSDPLAPRMNRKYAIDLMAVRTKWFDTQLLAALTSVPAPEAVPGMAAAACPDRVSPTSEGERDTVTVNAGFNNANPSRPVSSQSLPLVQESAAATLSVAPTGAAVSSLPVPRQVVLVGAGMDSRAWRLNLPEGVQWFEVDRQDVLRAKQSALRMAKAQVSGMAGHMNFPLKASCWTPVSADVSDPSWLKALQASGWDPSAPTIWVAEGLIMYLSPQQASQFFSGIAGCSAPGSMLVFNSVTDEVIASPRADRGLLATWQFGMPSDRSLAKQYLACRGWLADKVETRSDMVAAASLPGAHYSFDTRPENNRATLFFVAKCTSAVTPPTSSTL